jgi:hypothetical protein
MAWERVQPVIDYTPDHEEQGDQNGCPEAPGVDAIEVVASVKRNLVQFRRLILLGLHFPTSGAEGHEAAPTRYDHLALTLLPCVQNGVNEKAA